MEHGVRGLGVLSSWLWIGGPFWSVLLRFGSSFVQKHSAFRRGSGSKSGSRSEADRRKRKGTKRLSAGQNQLSLFSWRQFK